MYQRCERKKFHDYYELKNGTKFAFSWDNAIIYKFYNWCYEQKKKEYDFIHFIGALCDSDKICEDAIVFDERIR